MQRFILMIGLCWVCLATAQAQYASLRLSGCPGFAHAQGGESFYGGYGLGLHYEHTIHERGRILGALEFRSIQWGNQLALNLGYDYAYVSEGPWRLGARAQLQAGSALFGSGGLFVVGGEVGTVFQWKSPKAFFAVLGVGLRYTTCPSFAEYSSIFSVWEVPLTVGFGFKFGNRKG